MRTLFLGTLLFLACAGPARADDKLPSLQELGQVTGDAPLAGRLKQLLAQPEAAKKLIAEALSHLQRDQPLNFNAAFVLAKAAAKFKDLKAGEVLYRVAMAEAAKLQSPTKVSASYGGLIDLFYNNKKYAASAKVCQELIELKFDDGKPRHYYAEFHDPITKSPVFDEIEKYDPYSSLRPDVHRLRIQALTKDGRVDLALKLTANLIRNDDTWENRELKGWVLREVNRFAEAAKIYEDVIERISEDTNLKPAGREYFANYYRYLLSGIYVEAGNVNRAAGHLKALIEKEPDNATYYNDLGYIWADHNLNLNESEQLIRKALELDRAQQLKKNPKLKPNEVKGNGAYLDSLGWVLFKLKKYKEAKVELLKAVEDADAQHLEIYDHLGDVYLALGERQAALKAWRRGLELVGDSRRDLLRKTEVEKKLEQNK